MSSIRKSPQRFLYIESLLLALITLYMIALGFTHDKEWAPYLGVIVFAAAASAGLFALARGIKAGKRWAVAPSMLANFIALGVAYYQFEGHFYIGGVIIVLVALPTLFGLFKIAKDFD
jgi:peptidoglycan/LPS O-acetylase OafA/YrhL